MTTIPHMGTPTGQKRREYKSSLMPAQIGGKQGLELFFTLSTKNCSLSCDYCGARELDGKHPPLSPSEAKEQMDVFFGKLSQSERNKVLKVSLISMSDSLLNPDTIEPDALILIAKSLPDFLPNIVEAAIESLGSMTDNKALATAKRFFDELSNGLKMPGLKKEIAFGIDTANEKIRNDAGKTVSDKQIEDLAAALAQLGWNFRSYFIYNLLQRDENGWVVRRAANFVNRLLGRDGNVGALKSAVDFMDSLRKKTNVNLSMLILPGYLPEGKENAKSFKRFKEVSDATALKQLWIAAKYARKKGLEFEIDSTPEDREAVKAGLLSPAFTSALVTYNLTLDPNNLILKHENIKQN